MKTKLLLITLGFTLLFPPAKAQEIAEQPCDSAFWTQMTARAWQEAEREIMQNQNLIFKPDSVLDYTCFDQFANIAAAQGGEIFTHTNYFGEQIIQRSQNESTNNAISAVVSFPVRSYKNSQFPHTFLGGRTPNLGSSTTNHTPTSPAGGNSATYNCSNMSRIWQTAKCANFIDNEAFSQIDGFFPFKRIAGFNGGNDVQSYEEIEDTRAYPSSCNTNLQSTGILSWQTSNLLAENRSEINYQFQSPLGEIFKEVNDRIEPGNCEALGIRTGVQIITKDGAEGQDGVCTNPGCTYTEGGVCDGSTGGG